MKSASGTPRERSVPPTPRSPMFESPSRSPSMYEMEEEEVIHPGTRPFTAPEILRLSSAPYPNHPINALLADAYSLGIILLCLDLAQLVDLDPEYQKQDGVLDTSQCEVFGERVGEWYCVNVERRREVKKEDRIS